VVRCSRALPARRPAGSQRSGGIGNLSIRIHVYRTLIEAGYACPAVIHPTAWVENSARLSPGVQVFAHAYIGSEARVGFGCIVNTGAIISHDCWLDEYSNISPARSWQAK